MFDAGTYYTVAPEDSEVYSSDDWNTDLQTIKDDARDQAEGDSGEYIVYEISIRPLYKTYKTVELERI